MGKQEIFNRIQMMYGPARWLSDEAFITTEEGLIRLFKIGEHKTTQVVSGSSGRLYSSEGLVVIGAERFGAYSLQGDEVIEPIYQKLAYANHGKIVARISNSTESYGILDYSGEQLTALVYASATAYSSGVCALRHMDVTFLLANDGISRLPVENSGVTLYEKAILIERGVALDVYSNELDRLGLIATIDGKAVPMNFKSTYMSRDAYLNKEVELENHKVIILGEPQSQMDLGEAL